MGTTRALRDNDEFVRVGDRRQVVDASLLQHTERLNRKLHTVRDGVWCLVGNGLSNQTFIEGPLGLIAIDTGESVEEMQEALDEIRKVTNTPIVAVMYTHFHYASGTTAIMSSNPVSEVWGHSKIETNLRRSATEIAPAYGRGLVEQFAIQMPVDGPDGNVNVGLGLAYRMSRHAPFTPGHVPATREFSEPSTISVAGLTVEVTPAPSDADDSVTLWFPELEVAVHNLMWPALFNVFAIRGEEYRDPRVLLNGLDHLHSLGAAHLVATHGPPISDKVDIARRLRNYRDSIQFLWDQTVRWTNRGATTEELAHHIHLPEVFAQDWLTQQHYGVAEHHVRQIRTGLFGFFDGDTSKLLPVERVEHAELVIDAMGGLDSVRSRCDAAKELNPRWALELATSLVDHPEATDADNERLADVLRVVARRTTSANLRNWCLTKALDLDGTIDMSRHRTHRLTRRQVGNWTIAASVAVLRVMIEPERLVDIDHHVEFDIDGERAGLHFRNHIACPTNGATAESKVTMSRATWTDLLCEKLTWADAVTAGDVKVSGDVNGVTQCLSALDHPSFAGSYE